MHIRVGDTVEVIAGDESRLKPRHRGPVLEIDREDGKVIVEGANRVFKHVKKSQRNPQGGRLNKEMPIQISNVQLVCTSCGKATRTGSRVNSDSVKERFCKKCDAALGVISKSKKKGL